MSRGMKDLAVHSGQVSVFEKTGLTGLITANSEIVLWSLPKGTRILRAVVIEMTADTTTTADVAIIANEASPRTLATLDVSAAAEANMASNKANLAALNADVDIVLENTATGTGDGVYDVIIEATRPGPEPQ